MSPKPCSLAIDEIKDEGLISEDHLDFEPQLKIVVDRQRNKNSDSFISSRSVVIRGRMTVSF